MLGPVEDVLAASTRAPAADRERLESCTATALRLLQAGQHAARLLPHRGRPHSSRRTSPPIWRLHRRPGQRLPLRDRAGRAAAVVDCRPLGEPVYVDRDMWEKIVSTCSPTPSSSPSRARSRFGCGLFLLRLSPVLRGEGSGVRGGVLGKQTPAPNPSPRVAGGEGGRVELAHPSPLSQGRGGVELAHPSPPSRGVGRKGGNW